jgi:hypothetical protein
MRPLYQPRPHRRDPDNATAASGRIGAIGGTRGVRYWSVTDKAWQSLVLDANALEGPDTNRHRRDFSAAELKSCANLYYSQHDNRSSCEVVYRMRFRQVGAARVAIETENVTPIPFLLVTAFDPGALRSLFFLEPLSPGVWGIYEVTWVGSGSLLFGVTEASFINRAAAVLSLSGGDTHGSRAAGSAVRIAAPLLSRPFSLLKYRVAV